MLSQKSENLKRIVFYLKILVTLSLLGLVISKIDIKGLLPVLKNCNPIYILTALGIGFSNSIFQALRWKILINNKNIKFFKYLHFIYLGYFFKIFMPGSVTGDLAKVYLFSKKYNEPISNSTMIIIFQIMGILFQWVIGVIGYFMYRDIFNLSKITSQLNVRWGIVVIVGLIMLAIIFLAIKQKKLKSNLFLINIKQSFLNPKLISYSLGITFILQLLSFSNAFVIMKSVGIDIPFFLLAGILAIINSILIIPVSISGIGVVEYFSLFFFSDILLFSKEKIFSSNILGYGIILFFALAGGAWYLFRKLSSERELVK